MSHSCFQNIICTSACILQYYAKFEKAPTEIECKIMDRSSYIVSYLQATFKIFKLISLQAITTCGHSNYYSAIQHCTSTGQPTCNCLYHGHLRVYCFCTTSCSYTENQSVASQYYKELFEVATPVSQGRSSGGASVLGYFLPPEFLS